MVLNALPIEQHRGDGESKFRQQHASPEAWAKFSAMVADGRERRARGETLMVPRFEIVPIPPAMRAGLPAGAIMSFPFDVVESMLAFRPNDVVGRIAPRPLLLLHPAADVVTPSAQSIELFRRAGQPTDLHLITNIDHWMISSSNPGPSQILERWLQTYLPVRA